MMYSLMKMEVHFLVLSLEEMQTVCNGKVTIDGVTYQMDQNDNDNNLHSGLNGVDKKMWTVFHRI